MTKLCEKTAFPSRRVLPKNLLARFFLLDVVKLLNSWHFSILFLSSLSWIGSFEKQKKSVEMSRWSLFLSLLVLLCLSSQNVLINCQEEDGSDEQSGESAQGAISNVLDGALQGDIYLIEKGLKQGKESIDVTNGTYPSFDFFAKYIPKSLSLLLTDLILISYCQTMVGQQH